MRKSDIIVAAVLALLSIFLLWLWFCLGFNQVDSPLDLIISVLWWVVLAGAAYAVTCLEKTRRRQVRTLYVADGRCFNGESGMHDMSGEGSLVDSMAATLEGLEYGFQKAEEPKFGDGEDAVSFRWVVRTDEFKPAKRDDARHEGETWDGEVVDVVTGDVTKFSNREELAAIIA